jgi:hypothetical protein
MDSVGAIPPGIIETVLTIEDRRFFSISASIRLLQDGRSGLISRRAVWCRAAALSHATAGEEFILFAAADDGTKI